MNGSDRKILPSVLILPLLVLLFPLSLSARDAVDNASGVSPTDPDDSSIEVTGTKNNTGTESKNLSEPAGVPAEWVVWIENLQEDIAVLREADHQSTTRQEDLQRALDALAEQAESTRQMDAQGREDLKAAISELRRLLENQPQPVAPADISPDPYTARTFTLVVLILVLMALLIFLHLAGAGKSGRRRDTPSGISNPDLNALVSRLNTALDELQKHGGEKPAAEKDTGASDSTTKSVLERLEALPDPTEIHNRLDSLTHSLRNLDASVQNLHKDRAEMPHESASESGNPIQLPPPSWIRGGGLLQGFADSLRTAILEEKNAAALQFLGSALLLEGVMHNPSISRKEIAGILSDTSQAAYRYLTDARAMDADTVRKIMRAWIDNISERLAAKAVSIRLSQVYPGDSFQLATMEAVDSISGNRLTVDRPLSWLVEDTSESSARVLHRAKVITA